VGGLMGEVVHLPGHTPDHVGYWIGGRFFLSPFLSLAREVIW
jgi:glyoxylase-like metal-dependent hydrolase (beta-lactamase superfamily II)